MSTNRNTKTTPSLEDDYLALIRRFPLRPIRDEGEHDQAMALVEELAVFDEGTLPPGKQDYLDALTLLLEDYSRRDDDPPRRVRGVELLQSLVAANDLSVSDLGGIIGSQPSASLILSGRRAMSKAIMRRLGEHFGIDPGLFLCP